MAFFSAINDCQYCYDKCLEEYKLDIFDPVCEIFCKASFQGEEGLKEIDGFHSLFPKGNEELSSEKMLKSSKKVLLVIFDAFD